MSVSATSFGMTSRQDRLLAFIVSYCAEHGVPPTFREMAAALGIASKSGVARLVRALERRGRIRTLRNAVRSIVVVDAEPLSAVPTGDLLAELRRRHFDFQKEAQHAVTVS